MNWKCFGLTVLAGVGLVGVAFLACAGMMWLDDVLFRGAGLAALMATAVLGAAVVIGREGCD